MDEEKAQSDERRREFEEQRSRIESALTVHKPSIADF